MASPTKRLWLVAAGAWDRPATSFQTAQFADGASAALDARTSATAAPTRRYDHICVKAPAHTSVFELPSTQ